MEFIKYKTKEEFLDDNLEILLKDEAKNEIMIGILLEHEDSSIQNWTLGRIESNGEVKAIFLVEDEREGLLVYSPEEMITEEVADYLVDNLLEQKVILKEVLTSEKDSKLIGKKYAQKSGKEMFIEQNMYIMTFDEIDEEKLLVENERIEKLEKETVDYSILKENIKEMYRDNFRGRECSDEDAKKVAEAFLRKGIYVLRNESGEIVSQAVTVRKQINCCAIGGVITLERYRGHGYAKRLVHTLSNKLLKDGCKKVVLHVNSQNEPAISIYSKIGFKKIDETTKIKFI